MNLKIKQKIQKYSKYVLPINTSFFIISLVVNIFCFKSKTTTYKWTKRVPKVVKIKQKKIFNNNCICMCVCRFGCLLHHFLFIYCKLFVLCLNGEVNKKKIKRKQRKSHYQSVLGCMPFKIAFFYKRTKIFTQNEQ